MKSTSPDVDPVYHDQSPAAKDTGGSQELPKLFVLCTDYGCGEQDCGEPECAESRQSFDTDDVIAVGFEYGGEAIVHGRDEHTSDRYFQVCSSAAEALKLHSAAWFVRLVYL